MNTSKKLDSIFYCWHDKMLYLGPIPSSKPHGFLVPALSVGIHKKIKATINDQITTINFRSAIWPINYHHQTDTLNDIAGVLLFDPSALHFRTIMKKLKLNKHGFHSNLFFEKNIINVFKILYHEKPDAHTATALLDAVFIQPTNLVADEFAPIDSRVEIILNLLKKDPSQKHSLTKLAEKATISEVYLMQLFKKEMGTPIGKYHLWLKLCLASRSILQGNTLTHAAATAGFSDAAHYSRAFTSVMGVNPSIFHDDKQRVRTAIFDD